jgi:ABC-type phosphate transport system permease subunit
MMTVPPTSPVRFVKTSHGRRKEAQQAAAKWGFFAMAIVMIIPLLAIVGYLVGEAAPSLSWKFLVELPKNGMREGGIWPALLGTLYLVGL